MTLDQLIAEGRALQRDCTILERDGDGPIAAVWYDKNRAEIDRTGFRCWLSVDAQYIPSLSGSIRGYLSVFTDEDDCESGRVELTPKMPDRSGTLLRARSIAVLPPIDAVVARGSARVEHWIKSHGWCREDWCNHVPDLKMVREYTRIYMDECPVYREGPFAALGGWHGPGPDDDWHSLIDDQLLVWTFEDSEPRVEAWRLRSGEFRVIQRIT